MVEFQTIEEAEHKFGKNNFIEIALKKAVSDEAESVFVSVSRGFVPQIGGKRYRNSIAIPIDKELIDFVASKIKEMGERGLETAPASAGETEEKEEKEE